jgi:hypothetical protein
MIRFRIRDRQFPADSVYFNQGRVFGSNAEARAALASFHSADVEGTERMSLAELLDLGGWSLEPA